MKLSVLNYTSNSDVSIAYFVAVVGNCLISLCFTLGVTADMLFSFSVT